MRFRPHLCAALLLALAVTPAKAADLPVFFGTHSAGPTQGFTVAHFDTDTGALTAPAFQTQADAAAFFVFTPDARFLYTCNSIGNFNGQTHMGAISAYAVDPATAKLTLLNQQPSGGEDPSYISLDKTHHFALVANYQGNRTPGEGGTAAVFALKPDGSFGERTAFVQYKGSGIDPARQKQAYAHSIQTDPTNRFALVADLGQDKVFVYRFNAQDGSLTPNNPPAAPAKPGSGPRHLSFHPNGKFAYLVQEMGSMITAFRWDDQQGTLTPLQEISTLPADFKGTNTAAEIRVHPTGQFLYATNRGHDSVAAFAVDADTGKLSPLGTVPSAGKTPRNFEFDPAARWMIVTNHGSNTVGVFAIDQSTGKLTQKGDPVTVPNPFCPRFLPTPEK
jgi:6-phosphogluconolactonase